MFTASQSTSHWKRLISIITLFSAFLAFSLTHHVPYHAIISLYWLCCDVSEMKTSSPQTCNVISAPINWLSVVMSLLFYNVWKNHGDITSMIYFTVVEKCSSSSVKCLFLSQLLFWCLQLLCNCLILLCSTYVFAHSCQYVYQCIVMATGELQMVLVNTIWTPDGGHCQPSTCKAKLLTAEAFQRFQNFW